MGNRSASYIGTANVGASGRSRFACVAVYCAHIRAVLTDPYIWLNEYTIVAYILTAAWWSAYVLQ